MVYGSSLMWNLEGICDGNILVILLVRKYDNIVLVSSLAAIKFRLQGEKVCHNYVDIMVGTRGVTLE